MNENYAIHNLEEAKEHLEAIINELKKTKDLGEIDGDLRASFLELYWHINKVWNAKNISQQDIDNSTEEQFDEWCKFPKDMEEI